MEPTSRRTLLSRQVSLLHGLELDRVLVSRRRGMSDSREWIDNPEPVVGVSHHPTREITVVHDQGDGLGPLGGIVAAMSLAPERSLVVLAVDLGWISADLLQVLIDRSSPCVGAAPRLSSRWEPLCAVYPARVLERAEEVLAGPTRSPTELVNRLVADGTMRAYDLPLSRSAELRSWNRPEDLPSPVPEHPA